MALVVRDPPANAEDMGSIPGSGRSPGEGNGNRLQYACLGNSMDRGSCQSTVHGVAKSWTQLSTHTSFVGKGIRQWELSQYGWEENQYLPFRRQMDKTFPYFKCSDDV